MPLLRTASLIRSTSCWWRRRSFSAASLAARSTASRDFTRSAVARKRFSSLGSSQRRSALSRTSWKHSDHVTFDLMANHNLNLPDLCAVNVPMVNFERGPVSTMS